MMSLKRLKTKDNKQLEAIGVVIFEEVEYKGQQTLGSCWGSTF